MDKESKMQWLLEEWIIPLGMAVFVIWVAVTIVQMAS